MIIRPIKNEEIYLLEDFLYEAIFQPDKNNLVSRDIVNKPELLIYFKEFGKENDNCLVAEIDNKIVGAVWTRILSVIPKGYGNIDDKTPELSISVYEEHRNMGIGKKLMIEILTLLKEKGYKKVSLSVQKANYASKMYLDLGFEILRETSEEYIMIFNLNI